MFDRTLVIHGGERGDYNTEVTPYDVRFIFLPPEGEDEEPRAVAYFGFSWHGGGRKRSRAFYHQPPVLILDEPTSALDAEAEYEVFDNLLKSYKDKGLIFVSHRFSTVRNADKIFVIENGRITERGSHEELLKQNGKYATMFKCQAEGYK